MLPLTHKPHQRLTARPLDPELHVNLAVQLIHRAPDPGHLVRKVDLVAEDVARGLVRAQGVQRRRHHGRVEFLVVEDAEGGGDEDGDEEGEGPPDAEQRGRVGEFAVGAVFHQRA